MANLKGLDVSHWQGDIDWSAVKKAGYSFAFIKLTEGTSYVDPNGVKNVQSAQKAGFMVGGYHFFHGDAKESDHFRSVAKGLGLDYVILDSEDTSLEGDLTAASVSFLDAVADLGVAVFYSNPSYIHKHYNKAITKYPLWIAHYGVKNPELYLWEDWDAWQYDDKGKVPGISGNVDLNYMKESFGIQQLSEVKKDKPKSKPKPAPKKSSGGTYTVKAGDSLSVIGADLGVDWHEIAKLNNIKGPDYVIQTGQKLKLPGGAKKSKPRSNGGTYTVKSGDTLSEIGADLNVDWHDIASLNGIKGPKYIIQTGQKLKLPSGAKQSAKSKAKYHTVVSGDTAWGIAQANHTTVAALEKLNPSIKDMSIIKPGQKIRVK
ncbi:hypothetical protein GCM10011391_27920 [Pullulanibacillus camelliae]|uniref:Lysozyme n=1 Tax=Pullulanibacillus camelliae TaxID=1707096 RepID=A0A8J3DYM1_9BACL|nr:LysM peptidoglycan-binding domain-containing protein [Pullulanibacillus camelliae]GGE47534.1 hypothetical protein GCM10011391_27920 [Pullulanibacillus camelliae]